ncbi:MAG: tRNA ((7)-)-methyltransferase [Humibacillus sp.]|nr:tRNA ((7)-)-methyltransferase [Humibacillus sp.]
MSEQTDETVRPEPDGAAQQPAASTARVRSFVRRGRFDDVVRDRMARLAPTRALPPGRLDPRATFGREAPVVLEIGCGFGQAALAYAAAFPEHDLLATDVHVPGISRMLARAEEAGLPNLRVEVGDVVELLVDRVDDATFDAVHLFFPDPWPKNKHVKRRFINPGNLDLLARVLRPGGHVLVATDQDFYAAHVLAQVAAHPRFTASRTERPAWRPTDGFEAKGVAAGRSISELRLDLLP